MKISSLIEWVAGSVIWGILWFGFRQDIVDNIGEAIWVIFTVLIIIGDFFLLIRIIQNEE